MASPECKEGKDWNEYLEELIHVFKPVLLHKMRVSHILCLLNIKEVQEMEGILLEKEGSGDYKGAVEDLLGSIKRSDAQGKWQMLIDALREVEDTEVLRILLEEKSSDKQLNSDENDQLIKIFSRDIQKFLRLSPRMLTIMKEKKLILDADVERLTSMLDAGKKCHAIGVLLLIMHRHSEDWYEIFMGILCDDEGHFELAKGIDEKFCMKRKNSPDIEDESCSSPRLNEPQRLHSQKKEQGEEPQSVVHHQDQEPAGANVTAAVQGVKYREDSASAGGEASCQCQCCAQLLCKVNSLQSDLDEMKAQIRFLVGRFQDEN